MPQGDKSEGVSLTLQTDVQYIKGFAIGLHLKCYISSVLKIGCYFTLMIHAQIFWNLAIGGEKILLDISLELTLIPNVTAKKVMLLPWEIIKILRLYGLSGCMSFWYRF